MSKTWPSITQSYPTAEVCKLAKKISSACAIWRKIWANTASSRRMDRTRYIIPPLLPIPIDNHRYHLSFSCELLRVCVFARAHAWTRVNFPDVSWLTLNCISHKSTTFTCPYKARLLTMRWHSFWYVLMPNSGYLRRASSEVMSKISEQMLEAIIMVDESLVLSGHQRSIVV